MMNKIKEVSSKLTHSTRTLFNLICNDDKWSAKVMGCSVDAFEKGLVKGLDGIENGSDNDLMWAVEEMPKHLDILENKKGGNAITKMRNYIDAIIKGTDGEVNDKTRFIVIAILRAIAEDLLAKPEKVTEPTSDSKPVKHFTAKDVKADGSSDEPDVVNAKERSILDEWLSKAVRCEDKDMKVMQQKCAEELYSFIMDNLSKNAELAEIFTDMTVGRISNVTTVIAQRLFDMDTKVHGTIMHTEGIEKQLKRIVKSDGSETVDKEPTILDSLLAEHPVSVNKFVTDVLEYIVGHVDDVNIREVMGLKGIMPVINGLIWTVQNVVDNNAEYSKCIANDIKQGTTFSEQFDHIFTEYMKYLNKLHPEYAVAV